MTAVQRNSPIVNTHNLPRATAIEQSQTSASVESNSPTSTIAIFDLDGTITSRDTYVAFLLYVLRRRPARWYRTGWLALAVVIHKLGLRDNSWLKTVFLTAICGGLSRSDVATKVQGFVDTSYDTLVRKQATRQLQQHRQNGHHLLLATASFDIYVEEISRKLGFDAVICSRADWGQIDHLTGQLDGPNLYGSAKLKAVEAYLETTGPFDRIVAYTDHHSDAPLLNIADVPVAVTPTTKLAAFSKARGFEIQIWDS